MTKAARHSSLHPAQRFVASATMQKGSALAELVGPTSVGLLAESIAAVHPKFQSARFKRRALQGLEPLALMQRAAHVAGALAEQLPPDSDEALQVLIASYGPELTKTEGNGLAVFFYLPHSQFISLHGPQSFATGMKACYELTKRFSAEFCIRPLLAQHQAQALKLLNTWTKDANPHVRRLVSEGTRTRLPWGIRLKAFQQDPFPALALLEKLKDDPVRYVQRSVANHLGDVLKDNPEIAFAVCERWLDEARSARFDPERRASRLWILRHAVRLPAQKGDVRATKLRKLAK